MAGLDELKKLSPDEIELIVADKELLGELKNKYGDELQKIINPKGTIRKLTEAVVKSPALPIAGGVVGGIAGAVGGAGIASVPGAAAGATIGGAGGEAFRQLAARGLGMEVPKTSGEAAEQIGRRGVEMGAAEAVGGGVLAPIARYGGKLLAPTAKKTVELFSQLSGSSPQGFNIVFKNPLKLVTASVKRAGEAVGEQFAKAVGKETALEVVEEAYRTTGMSRSFAKKISMKIANNEEVSLRELARANRALGKFIQGVSGKEGQKKFLLNQQKDILGAIMETNLPALQKANKAFFEAKSVASLRHILPMSKTGEVSSFKALIGGAGLAAGSPLGLVFSPITTGALTAGAGAVRHAAIAGRRPALSAAASQSEQLIQAIIELAQRRKKRKK